MPGAGIEMGGMGIANNVTAIPGQELVLAVFHGAVFVRAIVEPDEHLVVLPNDTQQIVKALSQHAARTPNR